jgi:hypothetical protein
VNDAPTLRDLLGRLSEKELQPALDAAPDSRPPLPYPLRCVAALAAEGLDQELGGLTLYDLLAQGWLKARAVREAAAKSRATPGASCVLPLGEHELVHTCNPVVTVYFDDVPLPEIRFTLELVARLQSAELTLSDGCLCAISAGSGSAVVRLNYNAVKLVERSTPSVKVTSSFRFEPALPV